MRQIAGHRYINLESFRRDGKGVKTPLWFAADPAVPDRFYVYSTADSFKVKRVRRNPKVRLAPCTMRGEVLGDWINAQAEIVTGPEAAKAMRLLDRKYFPWKQVLGFFALFRKRDHTVIRLRPAEGSAGSA
ncbi:MAG: PPOX class F420-dependent oxidoreductase [Alphaproteobacteria bacterium]|nr:PPOX class F420-dependent oxidoreductase [Alphaproteobacteria bacterium]